MLLLPTDPAIRAMGRIDDSDPACPVWVYPYTQASFRFTGRSLRICLINHWNYGESCIGAIIDGVQIKASIQVNEEKTIVSLAENLPDIEHEVTVFKRQDGEHYIVLIGFIVDDNALVWGQATPRPVRRMEVYGDSVSCGERNEAIRYTGRPDPDADLSSYSNSWWSYAAMVARNFKAELHNISQGGLSLLNGTGWFNEPKSIGMESVWDRIQYNPSLGPTKFWNFKQFIPQVVVVAIGQNDSHPVNFMEEDYDGRSAVRWRREYADFILALRFHYPRSTIICATTVLEHCAKWDRAIDEVCRGIGGFGAEICMNTRNVARTIAGVHDPNIMHFLYSRNGSATPGHPRIDEHREMAQELTDYLRSLGPEIWND